MNFSSNPYPKPLCSIVSTKTGLLSTTPEYIDSLRENNRLLQEQNELLRAESEDRLARLLPVEEKITSLVNLVSEQQREIHYLKLVMFGEEEENDVLVYSVIRLIASRILHEICLLINPK